MSIHTEETDDAAETQYREDLLLPGDPPESCRRLKPMSIDSMALVVIALGVTMFGLYSARAIAFPLTLGAFVALPFRPIMRWCDRHSLPRFLSAGLLMSLCLGVVLLGALSLAGPAKEWLSDAPQKLTEAEVKLRSFAEPLKEINAATEKVENIADNADDSSGTLKVEVQQPRLSSTVLSATGDFAVGGMIAVSLAFLLLVFGDEMLKMIIASLPTGHDRRRLVQMFFEAEQTISRYLLTYTAINLALGVVIGCGLWLMGMPNPVLWGVMAAALNYIPFLGLIAGAAVVFVVAVLSFDSVPYACMAPAIYLAVNGIEANLVTPALLGRSMKMNTIAIFVSIVVLGWMWGIGGAIIAVPALALIKIACDNTQRLKSLSAALSG